MLIGRVKRHRAPFVEQVSGVEVRARRIAILYTVPQVGVPVLGVATIEAERHLVAGLPIRARLDDLLVTGCLEEGHESENLITLAAGSGTGWIIDGLHWIVEGRADVIGLAPRVSVAGIEVQAVARSEPIGESP